MMLIEDLKIWWKQGKQFIPDPELAQVPAPFRGRPELEATDAPTLAQLVAMCPTQAILADPFRIDLGRCLFCGECAQAAPNAVKFTNDHRLASNSRQGLVVEAGKKVPIALDPDLVRKEIQGIFGRSLKLRQISAAGDNAHEAELNACGNVNFDMGRYGIEFVASPRHADGIVITGPISKNMALATKICYDAVPSPKIVVLYGADAISGGIYAQSGGLDRSFLDDVPVDLYVAGNPPHPLSFIQGVLDLVRTRTK